MKCPRTTTGGPCHRQPQQPLTSDRAAAAALLPPCTCAGVCSRHKRDEAVMAAAQMIARAKHRHFRLFRWPPLKVGRLFMVQVVVAILWLRLIASWDTTEWSQESCRSSVWHAERLQSVVSNLTQISMWIAHNCRQQAGPFHLSRLLRSSAAVRACQYAGFGVLIWGTLRLTLLIQGWLVIITPVS